MPNTALDLLSLADAKSRLRISAGDADDNDTMLQGAIESAVDMFEKITGRTLTGDDRETATAGMVQTITLLAREFTEGRRELSPNSSIHFMVAQWRNQFGGSEDE